MDKIKVAATQMSCSNDINKNINGLNLSLNANIPFDNSSSQNANVSLSKKF